MYAFPGSGCEHHIWTLPNKQLQSPAQDRNGDTALHVAAAADDRLEPVVALTRLGADAGAANKSGHTALCAAAQLGRAAVVGLLLSQQQQLHLDPEGRHALHWAASAGHAKVTPPSVELGGLQI